MEALKVANYEDEIPEYLEPLPFSATDHAVERYYERVMKGKGYLIIKSDLFQRLRRQLMDMACKNSWSVWCDFRTTYFWNEELPAILVVEPKADGVYTILTIYPATEKTISELQQGIAPIGGW